MPFADFQGNPEVVHTIREMLARGHFPQSVILSGPQGSGKYTLAQMVAKAMNCIEQPISDSLPDFCGVCTNCVRIGEADALEERFAEAIEARENLRDADKKETRILVQTHPDVTIIPPDPPQMLVKVDQIRHIIREIYYRPSEARHRVYIFSEADFMKEAANSLLKILEEPPDFASIFLLTDNPSALLPTIRSRCMHLRLSALPTEAVDEYLANRRTDLKPKERALVARLSGGALGRAKGFDLAQYLTARQDALALVGPALGENEHSELFRVTDSYRAGADGKAKINQTIRTMYSLLEDMLFLKSGTTELVRNTDIEPQLRKMADQVEFAWIVEAANRLGELESGMRRNLLRTLALDAFATSLER
jgi:DNA polymerase III subunit delta'